MRRTLTVELPNGVRMPCIDQGDPTAPTVLLVHGVGDSGRAFEALLAHLPDSVRAVAPTLRGHGSASRPESGYRSADFAGDLAALMDALRIEAAVVVGASSGGQVALRLALDCPERILGVVLLGSPLRLSDKPAVREAWDSTFSLLEDPIDPDFVRDFIASTVVRPVPADVVENLVQESLRVPAFVWKATIAALLEDDLSPQTRGRRGADARGLGRPGRHPAAQRPRSPRDGDPRSTAPGLRGRRPCLLLGRRRARRRRPCGLRGVLGLEVAGDRCRWRPSRIVLKGCRAPPRSASSTDHRADGLPLCLRARHAADENPACPQRHLDVDAPAGPVRCCASTNADHGEDEVFGFEDAPVVFGTALTRSAPSPPRERRRLPR